FERQAEKVAQMFDHAPGKLRVPFQLRGDGVEGIEEKMRIQLHSKRVQTRLGQVLFQALQAQLTGNKVIVIAMRLPGSENQPINEPVPEKHALQRGGKEPDVEQAI